MEKFRVSFDVSGYSVGEMFRKARQELGDLYGVAGAWDIEIDVRAMVCNGAGERVGPWSGRVSASMTLPQ